MPGRAGLGVCCSGPWSCGLLPGVVDALALSRASGSGLLSCRVEVQFLLEPLSMGDGEPSGVAAGIDTKK